MEDWLLAAVLPYWFSLFLRILSRVPHVLLFVVGVMALLTRTQRKETSMEKDTTMKKLDLDDYLFGHPLLLPLWIWGVFYMFEVLSRAGAEGFVIAVFIVAVWLDMTCKATRRLCEYYAWLAEQPEGKLAWHFQLRDSLKAAD